VKVAAHGGPPPSFFIPAAKGKSRARISLNSLKYAIIERLVGGANLEGENIVLRQQVIVLSRKARSRSDGKSNPVLDLPPCTAVQSASAQRCRRTLPCNRALIFFRRLLANVA
jgi:hypothetical protein